MLSAIWVTFSGGSKSWSAAAHQGPAAPGKEAKLPARQAPRLT